MTDFVSVIILALWIKISLVASQVLLRNSYEDESLVFELQHPNT